MTEVEEEDTRVEVEVAVPVLVTLSRKENAPEAQVADSLMIAVEAEVCNQISRQ